MIRMTFWRLMLLAAACACISGCLRNAVHPVTGDRELIPDSRHAIVVIGVGLEAPWPFEHLSLVWDEYSTETQSIAGNCFRYNRIQVDRPSSPAKVAYFAYRVPAGVYVYSSFNGNEARLSVAPGAGFVAPPGRTVYFGDFVFVGGQAVELRNDLEAARSSVRGRLSHGAVLEPAEGATMAHFHGFMCTP